MTNFIFLKKVDKNLFDIISEAEKLYRDEYFEQCMTQTRRYAENVCKKVLSDRRTTESTFDDMLATLKDLSMGKSEIAKEFVEDLYFLKKHGNQSTHSSFVKKDGMEALECLQRAFEVGINYSVYTKQASKDILNLQYDIELLVTGKKSKETLSDKYKAEKEKTKIDKSATHPKKLITNQSYTMSVVKPKNKMSKFWIFIGLSLLVSFVLLIYMAII